MTTDGPARDRPARDRLTVLLGTTLRRSRERHGLTQRKLAALAGVTQGAVARIERGDRTASAPMLARLFAAMGEQLTVGVEPLDADLDAALDALAATPLDERIADTEVGSVRDRLTGIPYVFAGATAALLQGAPVPVTAVDVALRWADADAFTHWLSHNYGQRWHSAWETYGFLPLDPRLPGEHRWRTAWGTIAARFGEELPASITVRVAGRDHAVVPLIEVEIDGGRAADLLARYRVRRATS